MSPTRTGEASRPRPAESPAPLSGRAVRRATLYLTRRHGQSSFGEMLSDVYSVIITLAINIAMVAGLARSQGIARAEPASSGLDLGWVALLAALAAVGLGLGLLARLGPVSVSAAQAGWWLPLPADRRSLLLPAAIRPAAIAGGGGGVVLLLVALALDPALTVPGGAAAALAGAGFGAVLAFALVPVEASGRRRTVAAGGDVLLAATPVLALGLVLTRPAAPAGGGWPLLALIAVILAAATFAGARATVAAVHDGELRERGAVSGELRGAALSLDTRALGRAIGGDARQRRRRRSTDFGLLTRLTAGPMGRRSDLRAGVALVTADATVLRRSARGIVQILSGTALAVAALLLPEIPAVGTAVLVVVGGWVAALPTGSGARAGEFVPSLDALLPLSQRAVRRWRLVVPTGVMLLWALTVFAVAAVRYDQPGRWLLLGVLAAPLWAAGVLRSAYRPPPDWSKPLVVTPMGAYHPELAAAAARGPDIVVLGAIPLVLAVVVGHVAPTTLVLQVALTALVLAIAARPGKATEDSA